MRVGELEGFIAIGVESILIPGPKIHDWVVFGLRGKHLSDKIIQISIGEGDWDGVGLLCLDAPAILCE